jgi:hypothetical protein
VVYEIAVGRLIIGANWQTDHPSPTIVQAPTPVQTQVETSFLTTVEPAVGECIVVEITSIDAAGNRDGDSDCAAAGASGAAEPVPRAPPDESAPDSTDGMQMGTGSDDGAEDRI